MTGVRHQSKLMDDRLTVTYNQAPCRERSLYIVGDMTADDRSLKINDPDIDTLACALLERMYYCEVGGKFLPPPDVSAVTINTTLGMFRKQLLKQLTLLPMLSTDEFCMMYKGRKRTIYENAAEVYNYRGVKRSDSMSASFVKCEKIPPEKAPRCIQPRSPVYNIGLGRYIKQHEHRIYGAIGRVFCDKVTVIKGFNVCQVADIVAEKWQSFKKPVSVGLDATKFDMHVSEAMLLWEHSIYKHLFPRNKELTRLLSWQVDNKGVGYCENGKLRYSVRGKRFSGDMNTGLGNCLIMCAMVWTYAKEREVEIKLLNNGDDCQVIMESTQLPKFMLGLSEWFLRLGFRMTIEEPVYNLVEIDFCQMRCIRTARGNVMVRNIDKAREKDSMSIIPLSNNKIARKWMHAVGECGLALCGGVPIMQSMYQAYMRAGVPSKMGESVAMECGARRLAQGLASKALSITDEARLDCFKAWGYTPDEQVAVEQEYDRWVYSHSTFAVDNPSELSTLPL